MPPVGQDTREGRKQGQKVAPIEEARRRRQARARQDPPSDGFNLSELELAAGLQAEPPELDPPSADEVLGLQEHPRAPASAPADEPGCTPAIDEILTTISTHHERQAATTPSPFAPSSVDLRTATRPPRRGRRPSATRRPPRTHLVLAAAFGLLALVAAAAIGLTGAAPSRSRSPVNTTPFQLSLPAAAGVVPRTWQNTARGTGQPRHHPAAKHHPAAIHKTRRRTPSARGVFHPQTATQAAPAAVTQTTASQPAQTTTTPPSEPAPTQSTSSTTPTPDPTQQQAPTHQPAFGADGTLAPGSSPDS